MSEKDQIKNLDPNQEITIGTEISTEVAEYYSDLVEQLLLERKKYM